MALMAMLGLALLSFALMYYALRHIALKYGKQTDGPALRQNILIVLVAMPLVLGLSNVDWAGLRKSLTQSEEERIAEANAATAAMAPKEAAARAEKEAQAKIAAENQKREALHGKAPIPNPWDGSVREVEQYIKARAKDPDSVKFEHWSKISYNSKVGWLVLADWRATNSFGGYVREVNWFSISNGRIKMHPAGAFK